ncbi:MAG: large conductance mechanosensitive channel protein MscL [Clostridia bacterium]|nr:large conductance mechanosensitive channel protein MscL [Clostridia bacterium]MBQ8840970.1 large conductance mechanosensitive channel protein MscL [Clostridia bacterium]
MKKFFEEFKKFITRGNVVDMAVGVIVGGAFTGIVNGLSNYVLKPLINAVLALIIGKDGLSGAITVLSPVYVLDENGAATDVIDLASSIYIDWGSFISAIINFFIIAFVLFSIVKIINGVREGGEEARKAKEAKRALKAELKANGIDKKDKEAVAAYLAKKEAEAQAQAEAEAKAAEEAAEAERLANPTTEDLLKQIRDLLAENKSTK